MVADASLTAALLAGEMPHEIEDVFTRVGLSLFPASARDLALDCTCPDQAVPCKHLAAVCYVLAERFDADPFAMLALRGRDRETLLADLRERRAERGPRSGARHRRWPRCCPRSTPQVPCPRPRRARTPRRTPCSTRCRRSRWRYAAYRSPSSCAPPTARSAGHDGRMGELSPWHWAIVIIVLVVLFGARRLPDAARSLGRSARILKSELRAERRRLPRTRRPLTPAYHGADDFDHHKAIRGTIDATSPG